jgi:hypothetical protein
LGHVSTGRADRGWATYSFGTAIAFSVSSVLAAAAFAQNPTLMPPIGGLLQRLTIVTGLDLACFARVAPA